MANSASLCDLVQTEGKNALLPGDFRVQPYMFEPRRPTITISSQDSESENSKSEGKAFLKLFKIFNLYT